MTMTEDHAAEVITQRVELTAERMRITIASAQRYLTDDVLTDMAAALTDSLAEEAPGTDLTTAARTASMRVDTLGRLIAGLAETAQLYTDPTNTHVAALSSEDRTRRLHETLATLSICGIIQADTTTPIVPIPPALPVRIARMLTTAADLTDNTDLAAALRRDAMRAST
ncbi:hypothetical protein EEB19_22245 [Gordonia sp. OPL2]|nr:hypothetical protein EEB19_22245 [Gordonia sp. OPL2]